MHFQETSALPGPPSAVLALLSDEDVLRARAERTGALTHEARVTVEGDETVVRSRRTVPTRGLPPAAARVLGDTAEVHQEERWCAADADGAHRGSLRVTIAGAPVELVARALLRPVAVGSSHELDGDLDVRVPLLGRSVERAALPGLLDLLRAEVSVVRERLERG